MKRVAVMGGSSTGKTTVSRRLAEKLGVPHVELDSLHHDAGWNEAPAAVLQARVLAALNAARDGWVVDGNYRSKLGSLVLERAPEELRIAVPRLEVGQLLPQQHVVRIRRRRGESAVVGEVLDRTARERDRILVA